MSPTTYSARLATRRRGEGGFAIATVILAMVIAGIVTSAIIAATIRSTSDMKHSSGQITARSAASGGVQAIQQALHAERVTSPDGFTLSATKLATYAQNSTTDAGNGMGATTISTLSSAFPLINSTGSSLTVREPPGSDGLSNHWQIVRQIAPSLSTDASFTTVYVRGWRQTAGGTTATEPAVLKAQLRPGTFADYQLISDQAIAFDPNMFINGDIHSNGFLDGPTVPNPAKPDDRIWHKGTVSCQAVNGNLPPVISTAKGNIDLSGVAGCNPRPDTANFIDFARARESYLRVTSNCAPSLGVYCFNNTSPAATGRYNVSLTPGNANISGPDGRSYSIALGGQPQVALAFDRSVYVQGNPKGRITILAFHDAGDMNIPAPDIYIGTTLQPASQPVNTATSIGIIAENNVILASPTNGCTNTVRAALIATAGSVTIPLSWRTPTYQPNPPQPIPKCMAPLNFAGSMASHGTVTLRWQWGNPAAPVDWSGYATRNYTWDRSLRRFPPPYFPLSYPWEIVSTASGDADCYGDGRFARSNNQADIDRCR